jgi:hypothetical protein
MPVLRALMIVRLCRTSIVRVKEGSDVTDASRARREVLKRITDEVEAGGSVFWVFPLVDESEHFQGMGSAYQVRLHPPHLHLLCACAACVASCAPCATTRTRSLSCWRLRLCSA